jgi:small subunit ribosomal protein S3
MANDISVDIYTSRPGIVIGRGGQRIDEMRALIEKLIGKRIRLNIKEIRQPELEAHLVAKNVAEQMEHRISYRRAIKQAAFRTMEEGAKGIKIICAGRLGGAEIARREKLIQGRVPLHTLRADIDYGFAEAHTAFGHIGVKVWIYKGDILPEIPSEIEAAETSEEPQELVGAEQDVATEASEAPKTS